MRLRMRGIHFTMPTQEINQEMTIGVGGEEVRLLLPMVGPSPGNIAVYLPSSKVLFLGDIWQNGGVQKSTGADLKKWVEYLRKVQTWGVDFYVPGNGPPGDRQALDKFCKWLEGVEKSSGVNAAQ